MFFAYAAVVVSDRVTHLSVDSAVEYLYNIADDFGIAITALARLIVEEAVARAPTLK